jgi:N-acetylmuramoyl-L-alanine amidase
MNFKKIFLVFFLLTFFNSLIFSQNRDKVECIVIDAGHGGADPGALGKRVKEKDINLSVALKLGKLITDNYNDVKVIYTRKSDVAVDLYKRARIANDNHADLFISIHCNASENKAANGVETFVMGLHKSEASLAVAKKENAAILLEKNYENNYEGFNPNSPEANVIFSLYTSAYLKNSTLLASYVQKNLLNYTKFIDRKVQQAGFWVLYKVAMPSILIELGFISNVDEEAIMMKEENQIIMAKCIYNAIVEYKNKIEEDTKSFIPVDIIEKQSPVETPAINTPMDTTKQELVVKDSSNTISISYRVQFYATTDDLPIDHQKFRKLNDVKKYSENNWWKYTVGDEDSFEKAQKLLKEMKEKGYRDAFIVAFNNDSKITIDEAKRLSRKK